MNYSDREELKTNIQQHKIKIITNMKEKEKKRTLYILNI